MPTVLDQFDETQTLTRRLAAHLCLMKPPALLIIGAQKAGTSALHDMLSQHPQLAPGSRKELKYFNSGVIPYGDEIAYRCCFPFRWKTLGKLTFEATPEYMLDPDCPQRMRQFNPDIKLVAMLREPVARAYSAWAMFRRMRERSDGYFIGVSEERSFEDAINYELQSPLCSTANSPHLYIERGVYVRQLQRLLRFFHLNQSLKIIFYEEFFADVALGISDLCRFLNVRDDFEPPMSHNNRGNYAKDIATDVHGRLAEFFKPHNDSLATLLGRELPWGNTVGEVA